MTIKNHKIVCIMVFYKNCLHNGFSHKLLVCGGFLCILLVYGSKLLVCDGFSFELLAFG